MRAAAVLLVLGSCATAQEPITLKIRLPKGSSWKVDQVLDMKSDPAVKPGGEEPLVKGQYVLRETWTDEVQADVSGRPVKVKRKVQASKLAQGRKPGQATGYESCQLTLAEKEKEATCDLTFDKGKMSKVTTDILARGPVDPIALLFPADPVAVGGEWKVIAHWVCVFQRIVCAGLGSAKEDTHADLAGVLKNLKMHQAVASGCELTGKIASVKGNEAVIEFSGKSSSAEAELEITATLKWDVAKGVPVQLDWGQKREVKAPAFAEEWKLTKTWK